MGFLEGPKLKMNRIVLATERQTERNRQSPHLRNPHRLFRPDPQPPCRSLLKLDSRQRQWRPLPHILLTHRLNPSPSFASYPFQRALQLPPCLHSRAVPVEREILAVSYEMVKGKGVECLGGEVEILAESLDDEAERWELARAVANDGGRRWVWEVEVRAEGEGLPAGEGGA
eukprot:572092-Amorphochlora_amoeboformis.AAC.1